MNDRVCLRENFCADDMRFGEVVTISSSEKLKYFDGLFGLAMSDSTRSAPLKTTYTPTVSFSSFKKQIINVELMKPKL